MFDEPLIIDNVIGKKYQDHIMRTLLSAQIEWFYQHDITYPLEKMPEGFVPRPGLSHLYFDNVRGERPLSPWHHMTFPVLLEACSKASVSFGELMRSRSFLHFPANPNNDLLNHPHIDYEIPHLVCLYYVNDSDGPTVIYNETLKDVKEQDVKLEDMTVRMKVEPRKGRCVFFNGHIYHSSTQPVKGPRCVINFNMLSPSYDN